MTENRSRADEPAWRHEKGDGKDTEQQGDEKTEPEQKGDGTGRTQQN